MKKNTTNSFNKGMNTDFEPLTHPKTTLTDCLNGTMFTYLGNEYILQTERGNVKLVSEENPNIEIKLKDGFIPLALKEHAGVIFILSYNEEDGAGEVGSYPAIESGERILESVVFSNSQLQNGKYSKEIASIPKGVQFGIKQTFLTGIENLFKDEYDLTFYEKDKKTNTLKKILKPEDDILVIDLNNTSLLKFNEGLYQFDVEAAVVRRELRNVSYSGLIEESNIIDEKKAYSFNIRWEKTSEQGSVAIKGIKVNIKNVTDSTEESFYIDLGTVSLVNNVFTKKITIEGFDPSKEFTISIIPYSQFAEYPNLKYFFTTFKTNVASSNITLDWGFDPDSLYEINGYVSSANLFFRLLAEDGVTEIPFLNAKIKTHYLIDSPPSSLSMDGVSYEQGKRYTIPLNKPAGPDFQYWYNDSLPPSDNNLTAGVLTAIMFEFTVSTQVFRYYRIFALDVRPDVMLPTNNGINVGKCKLFVNYYKDYYKAGKTFSEFLNLGSQTYNTNFSFTQESGGSITAPATCLETSKKSFSSNGIYSGTRLKSVRSERRYKFQFGNDTDPLMTFKMSTILPYNNIYYGVTIKINNSDTNYCYGKEISGYILSNTNQNFNMFVGGNGDYTNSISISNNNTGYNLTSFWNNVTSWSGGQSPETPRPTFSLLTSKNNNEFKFVGFQSGSNAIILASELNIVEKSSPSYGNWSPTSFKLQGYSELKPGRYFKNYKFIIETKLYDLFFNGFISVNGATSVDMNVSELGSFANSLSKVEVNLIKDFASHSTFGNTSTTISTNGSQMIGISQIGDGFVTRSEMQDAYYNGDQSTPPIARPC